MTISDEIKRLQELHTQGALSDAEFAQAKVSVLSAARTPQADSTQASLEEIKFQNELARLGF